MKSKERLKMKPKIWILFLLLASPIPLSAVEHRHQRLTAQEREDVLILSCAAISIAIVATVLVSYNQGTKVSPLGQQQDQIARLTKKVTELESALEKQKSISKANIDAGINTDF